MPNATLCAKALVDMLLPHPHTADVQTTLVTSGALPHAYLITQERIERCEGLESVHVQDEKGIVGRGNGSLERLVRAGREGRVGGD